MSNETDSLLPTSETAVSSSTSTEGTTDYDSTGMTTATATTTETGEEHRRRQHHRRGTSLMGTIVEGVENIAENVVEGVGHMATTTQDAAIEFKDIIVDHVVDPIVDGAGNVADNLVEEAIDIKDALLDDLHEKDDGHSFFMEMGLARNLSLLPSDLEQVAVQMHQHTVLEEAAAAGEDESDAGGLTGSVASVKNDGDIEALLDVIKTDEPPMDGTIPFSAYLTLACAIFSLSSIGPSLDLQQRVDPIMKIYWRMSATAMVLFPLALRAILLEGGAGIPHMSTTHWCTFVLAACCYAGMCVCFVVSLDYTSVGNAVIFSNAQAILLLIGKFLVGDPVSLMEGCGAVVAFAGGAFCATDSSATSAKDLTIVDGESATAVWAGWGDLCALLSATFGVGYLVFSKTIRNSVSSIFVFMFLIMFPGSMFVLLLLLISGAETEISRDIDHGIWGWMNMRFDRLPLEVWMVVVCNLLGATGYIRSMQYFDNLTISVATLLEPVVASFTAYMLHIGLLPGPSGWIGNLLVAAGTVAVIYPNSHKKGASGGH